MPFPNIKDNEPYGSDLVSTIDDKERETRSWLKECMQQVSGYEDGVTTVSVKGWTNSTKPTHNSGENYLLGYNEEEGCLELIGTTVDDVTDTISLLGNEVMKRIALFVYPVGSYYWTDSDTFNPQTAWGGGWDLIQDGACLISRNPAWSGQEYAMHATGGSRTAQLEIPNLPPHDHSHYHKHRHTAGDLKITGEFAGAGSTNNSNPNERPSYPPEKNAFYLKSKGTGVPVDFDGSRGDTVGFDSSRSGATSGRTSEDTTLNSRGTVGQQTPFSIMQPYRVGKLWLRVR